MAISSDGGGTALPPATRGLLAAHVAAFVLQYLAGDAVAPFVLWPLRDGFEPWQLLTYGFLHGGATHFVLNMFGLWVFAGAVEHALGARRFIGYYLACIVGAGLVQLMVTDDAPTVGASGGVYGVLLAVGLLYPHVRMRLLFPPIEMPAWGMALGYAAMSFVMGVTRMQEGVAHFAHLGGMLTGLVLLLAWRRPRRR